MPTPQTGYIDSLHGSRLNHLKGTAYPTPPAGTFLALYAGSLPLSDGSGGNEVTGTRPAVTFGTPQIAPDNRQYMTNTSPITVTLTNAAPAEMVGFGICGAATGGTPIYVERLASPFPVGAGATITLPSGAIRVYSEAAR